MCQKITEKIVDKNSCQTDRGGGGGKIKERNTTKKWEVEIMRLRKTMKRTAAAVLALSMAVSAVAAPASAAYICDVSQGNVEISRDGSYTSITVGGKKVNDNGDGTNDIIIIGDNTGDNTKPTATESLNAEEENTSEVEKSGENASEVEKSGETKTEGEDEGDEPTSQELLAPEDEEKQAQQKETQEKPADSQEPEQTEKTSDQVIEYGQYDPEAQQEAAKPAPKPAAEQKAEEKKPAEEKTYEATNAPTTLSEGVQAAANNVVSIINNSANALKVILRNLKVDAGDATQNAMTIKGKGNVTLELDGKNELTGGTGCRQPSVYRGSGLDSYDQTGTLTITDEDKNGSLTAVGGDVVGVVSNSWYGGNGIYANNLTISGATVTAVGGGADDRGSNEVSQNGSKGGYGINAKGNVKFSNATVTATGGSAFSDKTSVEGGNGLNIISNGEFIIDSGTNLTATGGSAESKTGYVEGGQGLYLGGDLKKMTVNGATVTLAGGNAKTNSTGYSSEAGVGMGTYSAKDTEITNSKVTVIGGDRTGGRTEKARAVKITIGSKDSFKLNGDTTFTGIGIIQTTVGKITVAGDATLVKEDCKYEYAKIEPEENGKIYTLGDITVTENEDGTKTISGTLTGKKVAGHDYKVVSIEEPTCTTPGKRVYTCTTEGHEGETYEETIDALGHDFVDGVCNRCGAPEQAAAENGGSSAVTLTVTGAGAYETSIADGRYVVAVPAETAVLSGCLSNLKELKAQGVNTLVFRTQLRETVLNIDSMLSLGVDDTLFTLTHNGEGASLTIGGFEHNELIH
jgi:outer membrane biosynthesis protein TonB